MLLIIHFKDETLPFIMSEATEAEVLHAIEVAKKDYRFVKDTAIIESDRIILHAWDKISKPYPRKRLYCYNDQVILQTDTKYKEEVEPTRQLLAYERGISPNQICVVEI